MTGLDIERPEALIDWLRASGRIGGLEQPLIRVLAGGVSNRTVLVERPTGEAWVLKQALSRLRVDVEWWSSPERVHREALGMRWLATLAPPGAICPLVFEDWEHHVVAMRAVPAPHDNWKHRLLAGEVNVDHVQQFGRLLGVIHRSARLAGAGLREVFDDRSFFESLRLEPFYQFTAGRVPAAASFLDHLVEETRMIRTTLVHGDYSPKNILVHRGQLVLIDHEVIHWGDPMFDVGFALAHLLSKAHRLREHRASIAASALLFWKHYQLAAHDAVEAATDPLRAIRHTLGCLLARAAGRSQLEYLGAEGKRRQCEAVLSLIHAPTTSVDSLVQAFVGALAILESSQPSSPCPPSSGSMPLKSSTAEAGPPSRPPAT